MTSEVAKLEIVLVLWLTQSSFICEPNFDDNLTFETHRAMKLKMDKKSWVI